MKMFFWSFWGLFSRGVIGREVTMRCSVWCSCVCGCSWGDSYTVYDASNCGCVLLPKKNVFLSASNLRYQRFATRPRPPSSFGQPTALPYPAPAREHTAIFFSIMFLFFFFGFRTLSFFSQSIRERSETKPSPNKERSSARPQWSGCKSGERPSKPSIPQLPPQEPRPPPAAAANHPTEQTTRAPPPLSSGATTRS